jgi:hypothetical protein
MRPGIIIYNKLKLAFIHVPKNAGLSVIHSIRTHSPRTSGTLGHYPMRNLSDSELSQLNALKTFAVVRNPWSRLVSGYCFLRQGGINRKDKLRKILLTPLLRLEFNKFVRYSSRILLVKGYFEPLYERNSYYLWLLLHILPQSYWICSNSKRILVKRIIRFESLQSEISQLMSENGIDNFILSHRNKSINTDYQNWYTEESRNLVGEIYKSDVETFDYTF